MNYLIITGSPVGGLYFIGPFTDREEATQHAATYCSGDWWISTITPAEEDIEFVRSSL